MVSVQVFTAAYANPCGISNHCLLLQGLFARSGGQTMVPFMFKKCLFFPGFRIRIRVRIRINLSCWIQIRIQIADPDPDPGGQK
jgi:hypothetical protein